MRRKIHKLRVSIRLIMVIILYLLFQYIYPYICPHIRTIRTSLIIQYKYCAGVPHNPHKPAQATRPQPISLRHQRSTGCSPNLHLCDASRPCKNRLHKTVPNLVVVRWCNQHPCREIALQGKFRALSGMFQCLLRFSISGSVSILIFLYRSFYHQKNFVNGNYEN